MDPKFTNYLEIISKLKENILDPLRYDYGDSALDCDPYKNNNIPCYCVSEFSLIMSGIYLIFFLTAILTFMCYNCKGKEANQYIEN